MRLKKLSLINWRSLSEAKMPLSNVNFIFGKNNEGKSSIIYGAEYALINRTPVSNDLISLQKEGTKESGVFVDIDGVGSISRYRKTASQINRLNEISVPDKDIVSTLQNSFGLDYDTIAIMFDSSKFTMMNKKDQKAFLLRLTGIALNAEKVIEYMDNPTDEAKDIVKREVGDRTLTIDDLESVYNSFYAKRRVVNKDLKDIKSTLKVQQESLPKDKPRELSYIKADLEKVVNALKEIEKTIVIYNERVAQKTKIETSIKKGMENIDIVKAKIDDKIPHTKEDIDKIDKENEVLLKEKSELDKQNGVLSSTITNTLRAITSITPNVTVDNIMSDDSIAIGEDITSLNANTTLLLNEKSANAQELGGLEANIKSAKAMIEKLSTTQCPLSAAIECNYDKKPMLKEINDNIDAWTKKVTTIKKRNEEIDDIVIKNNKIIIKTTKSNLVDVEKKIKELSTKIETNNQNKKVIENQIKCIEWLDNAMVGIDNCKKELNELEVPKIEGLMEKKKEYEDKQAMFVEEQKLAEKYAKDVATIKETKNKCTTLDNNAKLYDYLVNEFAPNGVRSRFLKKIIAPVVDMANKRLDILASGYSLEFNFDKDFDIYVTTKTGKLLFEQLSVSEKLRIQIIIQDAINCLKNVGLMVIDEVGLLDDGNFIALLDLIKELAPSYGNIFIVGTKEKDKVVSVSEHLYNVADDVSVFYLENNEVSKL